MHSPWLARANEPALHKLDSHTGIQVVLACELVELRGSQWIQFFFKFSICP